jgi:HAD superfamily hydrolase (TIGR01509 family)
MNYAFLFDLDGVLVDSKELHFTALNIALAEVDSRFVISREEQASVYEGLTTRSKLEILHRLKDLPKDLFGRIWQSKQKHTALLFKDIQPDQELVEIFTHIKNLGISTGVVSNSIRDTLDCCLSGLGVAGLVDVSVSNEDVFTPKPNPEGYLLAMEKLGVHAGISAIFEDSPIGLEAATKSKAYVVPIENRGALTLDIIDMSIKTLKAGNR